MTEQPSIFDQHDSATERRDRALARVGARAGTFIDDVRRIVAQHAVGAQVTGEQIRLLCERHSVTPHHHNAWGAAISTLVKRRVLDFTGRFEPMQTKKSHARRTPVYVVRAR